MLVSISTCPSHGSISLHPIVSIPYVTDSRRKGRKAEWVPSWQFCPPCSHPYPVAAISLEMKCYVKRQNKKNRENTFSFLTVQDFLPSLRKWCRVNPKALESHPESWMCVVYGRDVASGPLSFHSDAKFPEGRYHTGPRSSPVSPT